jgi:hypothetical protein
MRNKETFLDKSYRRQKRNVGKELADFFIR